MGPFETVVGEGVIAEYPLKPGGNVLDTTDS